MVSKILVAGGTGKLGEKIISALIKRGASVRVIIRKESDKIKLEKFANTGVEMVQADFNNPEELTQACENVSCVISALAGLEDVIIKAQTSLLDAAVKAGVPRFIPSDFSVDYTKLSPGENRNFDLRRSFQSIIDQAPIEATSIFNGAFAEILAYGTPLLEQRKRFAGYWGDNPGWHLDFTTMDDTANYTAAAALDKSTPRALHIASFQVSPNEFTVAAKEITNTDFQLVRMGSLEEFAAANKEQRRADPAEHNLYPKWQNGQYMHDMFMSHHEVLDNNRYPDIIWIDLHTFLKSILQ